MKASRILVAFAGVLLMNIGALADSALTSAPSVQQLRDGCKKPDHSPDQAFCLGYIEGIGQLMAINSETLRDVADKKASGSWIAKTSICLKQIGSWPSGGAMEQAFINWAEQHPEQWSDGAIGGVVVALRSTWPCPISN